MWTLLPAPDEMYCGIKRYFHTLPFQNYFVFYLIILFLKGFLVLSDLLKPASGESSKENP